MKNILKIIIVFFVYINNVFAVCPATAPPGNEPSQIMPNTWVEVASFGPGPFSAGTPQIDNVFFQGEVLELPAVTCGSAEQIASSNYQNRYCINSAADDPATPENEASITAVYADSVALECPLFYGISSGQCVIINQSQCDLENPEICPDGFAADLFGYIGCDRPPLQSCSDGQIILADDACAVVCGDRQTCEEFALIDNQCNVNQIIEFIYTDPLNFSITCTDIQFDSPDLADNGGNQDGNPNNDPFSDPAQFTPVAETDSTNLASEIADQINPVISDVERSIRDQIESDSTNTDKIITAIDGIGQVLTDQQGSGVCDPTSTNYFTCLNGTPSAVTDYPTTVNQAFENFYSSIKSAPVIASFANVTNIFSGSGSCPPFSIDFPSPINQTIGTDIHCTTLLSNQQLISTLFNVFWILVGFRIIASS